MNMCHWLHEAAYSGSQGMQHDCMLSLCMRREVLCKQCYCMHQQAAYRMSRCCSTGI